jgi:hypothetical protein
LRYGDHLAANAFGTREALGVLHGRRAIGEIAPPRREPRKEGDQRSVG